VSSVFSTSCDSLIVVAAASRMRLKHSKAGIERTGTLAPVYGTIVPFGDLGVLPVPYRLYRRSASGLVSK
jgi:hypothetical protein